MGRNKEHITEWLKIGERYELKGKLRKYSHQYVYEFNKRGKEKFKHVIEDKKVYAERIS